MNDNIKYWLEGLDDLSFNKVLDYITNLQKENERLKHQLKVQEDLTIKNRMRKHIYKSRCEKANKYVNCRIEEFKNAGSSRKEINAHDYYMLLCDIEKILISSP